MLDSKDMNEIVNLFEPNACYSVKVLMFISFIQSDDNLCLTCLYTGVSGTLPEPNKIEQFIICDGDRKTIF